VGRLREEVRARRAAAGLLGDGAVAIGRATEHMDRPQTGGVACTPAGPFEKLGPCICGHQPLHWEPQSIFRAPPSRAVQADARHAAAPAFVAP
jgi:hypothetical protein